MKKIVLSTMGAFFLTAVMLSCNQPKETEVSPTTAQAGEEPTSVIELMEKENKITYFKKDVVLKDANGSEITMRFASEKQEHLDMYLAMHDFTLNSSFKTSSMEGTAAVANESPTNKSIIAPDLSNAIHVISEQVRAKLADGIKSYSLTTAASKRLRNTRISQREQFYIEEISPPNRPDGFNITVGWDMVWLAMDFRENWYNPNWVPIYFGYPNAWKQIYPTSGTFHVALGGDPGCWKAKSKIHYSWDWTFNYVRDWPS